MTPYREKLFLACILHTSDLTQKTWYISTYHLFNSTRTRRTFQVKQVRWYDNTRFIFDRSYLKHQSHFCTLGNTRRETPFLIFIRVQKFWIKTTSFSTMVLMFLSSTHSKVPVVRAPARRTQASAGIQISARHREVPPRRCVKASVRRKPVHACNRLNV